MLRRLPKADVHWLSQQLTAVVESLMPSSEECARQAAAFDKVSLVPPQHAGIVRGTVLASVALLLYKHHVGGSNASPC